MKTLKKLIRLCLEALSYGVYCAIWIILLLKIDKCISRIIDYIIDNK